MHHRIVAAVVLAEFVDLGVAVMAAGNAIIGAGSLDLLIFQATILEALFLEPGLQESASATAAKVVGAIGRHINEILLAHHRLDHETKIFGDGIAVAFTHDLAGVLDGEFNLQLLVPVGVDLELSFPDPFGVVFIDILDFKVVLEVELFQSGPD
jgi:hypothetical protein